MDFIHFFLINLFIIVYLFIAVFRTSRSESAWVKAIREWIDPIIEPLGLYQFWGMFAPEPHHTNNRFVAQISFVSDPSVTWTLENNELSKLNRSMKTRRVIFEKNALANEKVQEAIRDYLVRKYQQPGKRLKEIKFIGYFQTASGVTDSEKKYQPSVAILGTYPIN